METKVKVPATLRAVRSVCMIVKAIASDLFEEMQFAEQVEIGVAEAVNNIVKHGYKLDGSGIVTAVISADSRSIEISISDTAPHFNPLADMPVEDAPFDYSNATEQSLHMGRIIMREAMDSLEYHRLDHGNLLIMRKTTANRGRKEDAPS